jgi:outer membrane protein assembly factor BamB
MNEAEPKSEAVPAPPRARRAIRWWPAVVILALAATAVSYVRLAGERSHQEQNIQTLLIGVAAGVLLLGWALLFSRLGWKVRLLVLAAVVAGGGLAAALFEIRGVTGDLRPIVKPRWDRPAPLEPPTAVAAPASTGTAVPSATDFPQFLGPQRNATVPDGVKLARDWSRTPPRLLWRQPVGAGWSGFAVVGGRAVTQEQRGETEAVVCYDLLTGRVLWTHTDPARYFTTIAGEGPRATPSITAGKVLALGATGLLNCLDLASGRRLWSTNILAANDAPLPEWGVAGSPLVQDGLVIVNPGGANARSLVAYRLADGAFAWGAGEGRGSYSSPVPATLGGTRQVIIFNQRAVVGHDALTGQVLWTHPWDSSHPHPAAPVVLPGDRVLVSSGYGVGSELLQIERGSEGAFAARRLWKSIRLKAKFNNVVTKDGFVYGLDDGILACVDLATGELRWKEGRYGHGQCLLVGGLLLLTAENGEVVLIEPTPDERRELTKFAALRGKTWNPPALAGDLLLVRNDQEAACYLLPTAP